MRGLATPMTNHKHAHTPGPSKLRGGSLLILSNINYLIIPMRRKRTRMTTVVLRNGGHAGYRIMLLITLVTTRVLALTALSPHCVLSILVLRDVFSIDVFSNLYRCVLHDSRLVENKTACIMQKANSITI